MDGQGLQLGSYGLAVRGVLDLMPGSLLMETTSLCRRPARHNPRDDPGASPVDHP